LAALTIGWTACLCFFVAPLAFRTLKGRGETFVRRLIRQGHGVLAVSSLVAAGFSLLAGAMAGAAVMGTAGLFFFLAQWTLAPKNESETVPGVRNTARKHARVAASALTAFVMPVVLVGMTLIGFKV
ncbi:MAG: hypothetical protein AB7M12_02325, partial [Hyphomonadaceae bacterium]